MSDLRHGFERIVAAVVLVLAIAQSPSAFSAGRTLDEVRLSKSRFESVGAGYKQALSRLPMLSTAERDAVGDIRFIYEPLTLPRMQSVRQFGQRQIIVSDGWMALVEDLTRANALAAPPRDDACMPAFVSTALEVARDNLARSADPDAYQRAIPRFVQFVRDRNNVACSAVRRGDLLSRALEEHVRSGVDATLVWVIGLEVALQFDPRDVKPLPVVAARIAEAASAARQRELQKAVAAPLPPAASASVSAAADAAALTAGAAEEKKAVAIELQCRQTAAGARSIERAVGMRVDLLPGHVGVLAHEILFDRGEDAATCPDSRARMKMFFAAMEASGSPGVVAARRLNERIRAVVP